MKQFVKLTTPSKKTEAVPVKKFLTFTLGKEEYAIDLLKIQEIKGSRTTLAITNISDAPAHVRGFLYLHNTIIPVIDLRVFYHLITPEHAECKAIIILNIQEKIIGIAIDAVEDIVELTAEQIKPTPEIFTLIHHDYIEGIAAVDERLLILLDVEKLISSKEMLIDDDLKKAVNKA